MRTMELLNPIKPYKKFGRLCRNFIIQITSLRLQIHQHAPRVIRLIQAYIITIKENLRSKTIKINGVKFYYRDDVDMNDDLIKDLEQFSLTAEDKAYSMYYDGDILVVY